MIEFLNSLDELVDSKILSCLQDYGGDEAGAHSKSIGIIHFNIRSLRKHFDELLVQLQAIKDSVDVIVLSETENVEVLASAETVPELIQEFSSIIDTRVSEAGQLIGLVGKNIGQTYSEIENSIRGTAQDLQNEIDNAQALLKSQAKELAPNAAECVSAASSSLSSLSVDSLQSCSLSNELITVQKMIPQLALIPRQLGTLIPRCIAGAQNDPIILRSCLSDGLQRIDESSTSLNSDVQALMDKAMDGAGKCIENARSVIDNSIASITDTLNDCVKGANDA